MASHTWNWIWGKIQKIAAIELEESLFYLYTLFYRLVVCYCLKQEKSRRLTIFLSVSLGFVFDVSRNRRVCIHIPHCYLFLSVWWNFHLLKNLTLKKRKGKYKNVWVDTIPFPRVIVYLKGDRQQIRKCCLKSSGWMDLGKME